MLNGNASVPWHGGVVPAYHVSVPPPNQVGCQPIKVKVEVHLVHVCEKYYLPAFGILIMLNLK